MKKGMVGFVLVLMVLLSSQAFAATIEGTVFDFSLSQAKNARVVISTEPQQQIIAQDATYSFEVGSGRYTLIAQQIVGGKVIAQTEENITVSGEGLFKLDLILFPYFGDEEDVMDTSYTLDGAVSSGSGFGEYVGLIFLVVGLIVLAYVAFKKDEKSVVQELREQVVDVTAEKKEDVVEKKEDSKSVEKKIAEEMPADLQKMVDYLKTHEGRVTQKDMRKEFPQSEAKVSLMIADLEQRGLVKKIKKGRGNIIVLE
jgi:uncharacterized membrane protein